MLIVAWREMISGDNGVSVEKSTVCGSGCSLVRISYTSAGEGEDNVRQFRSLYRRQNISALLQRRLWLRRLHLLLLGHALIVAVVMVMVGLGLHAGRCCADSGGCS